LQACGLFAGSTVPPDSPTSGALEGIAVNPNNTSQIVAGTVNGGVWRTTNADPSNPGAITWTPLTDQLSSLSIGAVAFDPADHTGNTFYAGTGVFTNSFSAGGAAVGLYKTTDAGTTWSLLGQGTPGGHRIKAIVVTGSTILLGTIDGTGIDKNASRDYSVLGGGLFRSTDGGASFAQVVGTGSTDLPAGAVPSLAQDPNNPLRVFAAVAGVGVFRSDDGGATWAPFSQNLTGAAGSSDIELAVQNVGGATTLFAGVSNGDTLDGVFTTSSLTGGGWTGLAAVPAGFDAGSNFAEKFQLVADPTNAGVVYLDGQGGTGIFRYDPAGQGSWVQIDDTGTLDGTGAHDDSRDLKFLGTTALLESDDGGIYALPNPTDAAHNDWQSFNGNLRTAEFTSVAYDSTNHVLFGGAQDNGSSEQAAPGGTTWTQVAGGDGQFQQVDTTSLGGTSSATRWRTTSIPSSATATTTPTTR
jgi:hypothetical protein